MKPDNRFAFLLTACQTPRQYADLAMLFGEAAMGIATMMTGMENAESQNTALARLGDMREVSYEIVRISADFPKATASH